MTHPTGATGTYVYVLCIGERGEGHDPVSTWASLADALDEAQRRYGVRPTHLGGVQWKATLNGEVDEVWVKRFTLKGSNQAAGGAL